MSGLNDREKGFETKFAHDEELKFKAEMRRNKLLGLWAAELFGMSDEAAADYAKTIIRSDLEEVGDDDVFRKLKGDFESRNVEMSDHRIRREMDEKLAIAQKQVMEEV